MKGTASPRELGPFILVRNFNSLCPYLYQLPSKIGTDILEFFFLIQVHKLGV